MSTSDEATLDAVLDRLATAHYDSTLDAALDRAAPTVAAVQSDRLQAAALWAILEGTPPARRHRLIAADPRFHSWALAARYLDAAADLRWQDTARGLDACRLALAIAERLPAAAYPAGLDHDLRGRALGCLADALRLDDQLDAARRTLRQARSALGRGTRDPLERAALLRIEASLQLDTGHPAAAAALLRSAAAIYRTFGDHHQEGRTLQKLARAIGHEDPAHGAALAQRATALVEPGREPLLELAGRHLLSWFLNDCGHSTRALDELHRAAPLYRLCRDTEPHLLRPWLEARICRGLGELAAAERGLVAVWHDFHMAGFARDLTLVSLDLADTYLAQAKPRHALRLLKTFHTTLAHLQMHPEGMAAWLLLIQAAAGETAAAQALTRKAGLYFRRAWKRPMPFSPTSPGTS
jgi:hypothetical protein